MSFIFACLLFVFLRDLSFGDQTFGNYFNDKKRKIIRLFNNWSQYENKPIDELLSSVQILFKIIEPDIICDLLSCIKIFIIILCSD